jgi:hypothetical protein
MVMGMFLLRQPKKGAETLPNTCCERGNRLREAQFRPGLWVALSVSGNTVLGTRAPVVNKSQSPG